MFKISPSPSLYPSVLYVCLAFLDSSHKRHTWRPLDERKDVFLCARELACEYAG